MQRLGDAWLPSNETPRHWALKWAAWYVLRHYFGCYTACGIEVEAYRDAGNRGPYARQDAVGLRRDYEYRPHPTQLVHPSRLMGFRYIPGQRHTPPEPWLDITYTTPAGETVRQSHGVQLDGDQTVTVVNPKPNKNGEVRVRLSGSAKIEHRYIYGADAKQSVGDYRAWLAHWEERVAPLDIAVIVTPVGLLAAEDVPEPVGLIEIDPALFLLEEHHRGGTIAPNLVLAPQVKRQPERLRKHGPIDDLTWLRLQNDCLGGLANRVESTLHAVIWPAVREALAGAPEEER